METNLSKLKTNRAFVLTYPTGVLTRWISRDTGNAGGEALVGAEGVLTNGVKVTPHLPRAGDPGGRDADARVARVRLEQLFALLQRQISEEADVT